MQLLPSSVGAIGVGEMGGSSEVTGPLSETEQGQSKDNKFKLVLQCKHNTGKNYAYHYNSSKLSYSFPKLPENNRNWQGIHYICMCHSQGQLQ